MAKPGDVELFTFNVGGLDLLNPLQAKCLDINVYEDLLKPTLMADVVVLDETDALGRYKISGKEDVTLSFGVPGGGPINLQFKMLQNKDLEDGSARNFGAMKHKTYQLRMISPEILKNQAIRIHQSFNEPTHSIVQKVLKEVSDKQILTPDPTKGKQRIIANYQKPLDFLASIHERHVSQQFKSSAYTLFASRQGSEEALTFATFEYLMSQGSVFTYKQDNTIGHRTTTEGDGMSQLLWVSVPDSFYTPSRWNSASNRSTYNLHTGKQLAFDRQNSSGFVLLGAETFSESEKGEINGVPKLQKPQRSTIIDPSNDTSKTDIAQAKIERASFMAHLAQNTIRFEIHGNPDIKVGDVVTLNIPKKADSDWEAGETQMNDKVLIVKLRHYIRPAGNSPQYTMIVEAVKAAYKEGV